MALEVLWLPCATGMPHPGTFFPHSSYDYHMIMVYYIRNIHRRIFSVTLVCHPPVSRHPVTQIPMLEEATETELL